MSSSASDQSSHNAVPTGHTCPHVVAAEKRAAMLSLGVGIVLMLIKFVAYFLTGSAAIFSDALESIVNVLASGVALYAIILAHQPADREHPYGHGKVEFLSAGFEGGMIILAALVIITRAIEELISGPGLHELDFGLTLVGLAMLVNGGVGVYLVWRGRKSNSITLEADGKHLLSDAITSAVVLAALGVMRFTGWVWLDPIAAILVALYIVSMAAGLLRRSAAGLMDEQDRADDAMIRGILDSHLAPDGRQPLICSYHKLRHRHSGRYHWVDFHIMVPGKWDVDYGHRVASAIEYEIELALGQGNATAHVEPCTGDGCEACAAAAQANVELQQPQLRS
ncbi:cation diffusion facilitator family transporter [Fontivita pretiosa]|uniref:cation diffusion facilitator family transporter n=1 Tax=Fontivita pretiosa TaxID=2989684 RepID=UPI003D1824CD